MTTEVTAPPPRKLRRDREHAMIGGVCAGLAEFFGLDITVVRVVYAIVSIFTAFAGVLVYLLLWALVPVKE